MRGLRKATSLGVRNGIIIKGKKMRKRNMLTIIVLLFYGIWLWNINKEIQKLKELDNKGGTVYE